ncbi:hypothetical protein ANCCAN_03158 [Ancylostoma caninum]|uniref:Nucleotide-diphospho-sugar transferase domain-containing protein n=1 Tax=Ancylostoma caninum TaxID=29170 RepID=A0A368H2D8_ANCCA|nr:hypothetical protein ANCCAN_03158 [Ancylostoma caninum]
MNPTLHVIHSVWPCLWLQTTAEEDIRCFLIWYKMTSEEVAYLHGLVKKALLRFDTIFVMTDDTYVFSNVLMEVFPDSRAQKVLYSSLSERWLPTVKALYSCGEVFRTAGIFNCNSKVDSSAFFLLQSLIIELGDHTWGWRQSHARRCLQNIR